MVKKRQKGRLRQALSTSHPTSSSTIRLPIKNKGPIIQPVQRPPNPPHASPTYYASTSASSSSAASTELDTKVELSTASTEPEAKIKLVVSPIICENEGNEDMIANLRAGFRERQCKRMSESVMIVPPAKKPCIEVLCLELVSVIALAPEPSAAAIGTKPALNRRPSSVGATSHPELEGPSTSPTLLNDDSIECVAFVPLRP